MTDQPPNHATDQPTNQGDHAALTLDEAAARLGISVNAVRQRIKRQTLLAGRTPAGWVVWLPTTPTDQPTTGATRRPTTDQPPADHAGVGVLRDLLAEERAALAEERAKTERLIESATMWQVRALQAEDRLKQLTAGGDAPSEPQGALGRTESGQPVSDEGESWWRRVLGLTR